MKRAPLVTLNLCALGISVEMMEEGEPHEITTYRTEGPCSDSRRSDFVRFVSNLKENLTCWDFTMNAIAMDLQGDL